MEVPLTEVGAKMAVRREPSGSPCVQNGLFYTNVVAQNAGDIPDGDFEEFLVDPDPRDSAHFTGLLTSDVIRTIHENV